MKNKPKTIINAQDITNMDITITVQGVKLPIRLSDEQFIIMRDTFMMISKKVYVLTK